MSIWPIIGDFNFDYLIKVISARVLHSNVTTVTFVINKYLMKSYFESM